MLDIDGSPRASAPVNMDDQLVPNSEFQRPWNGVHSGQVAACNSIACVPLSSRTVVVAAADDEVDVVAVGHEADGEAPKSPHSWPSFASFHPCRTSGVRMSRLLPGAGLIAHGDVIQLANLLVPVSELAALLSAPRRPEKKVMAKA